jgi:predicted RNA polymerase sigma factor
VLAGLVRRGEDFDAAEDALQEALLEALRVWPEHPPRDPRAWLAAVATRRLVDVRVLQSALAVQRPGRYQVEAAIAALHDDAASSEETDWPQILAWYDDLVALTDHPVRQDPAAVLGRAVAVGHVLGAAAGLRETDRLREVLGERHRWHAVRGHLHELSGDLPAAATAYADAARRATDVAERDHLVRQAARARASIKP